MQLTLKNLLLYLDDALSPQDAATIGQKIAASPNAQKLIDALERLKRRRALSAPEIDQAKDPAHDANQVAAYLDGLLSDEEATAFERLCLEDAELLAEVAAVHQLRSLGQGEPVLVPPLARDRLYQLVSGQEADPKRFARPAQSSSPDLSWEVDGRPTEDEDPIFLEPLWFKFQKGWKGRIVPVLAMILLLCLCGVVYLSTQGRPEPSEGGLAQAQPTIPRAPASVPTATAPQPEPTMVAAADTAPERPAPPPPAEATPPTSTVPTAPAATAPEPAAPTGPAAPEPTATKPDVPPPPPPPPVPNVAVGQYTSDPARDGMILCFTGDKRWIVQRPQARLLSAEPILALPGTRADFLMSNKIKLTLQGTVPGATSINYFFETQATINYNDQVDLDVTLERGRMQLTGKPDGIATIKLRYQEEEWELRLLTPDTELGVEVTGRVPPGQGGWTPHSRLAIFVMKGELSAKRGETEERLGARKILVWDSVHSDSGPGMVVPQSEPPAWIVRRPTYPTEVREGLATLYKRIGDKLNAQGQDIAWLIIACEEALANSRRPWEQYLALFVLGALDQPAILVDAVDHGESPYVRRAAIDALLHFLGRQPGQNELLVDALKARGYGASDRDTFLLLIRRIDKPDRAATEQLLNWLAHSRLAIRELAFLNLIALLPPDRLAGYDPNAPLEQRERAIALLRQRLLK
ncbi:MAG TPA: hypothetical protein PKC45_06965 [Gemmatales bacterium]|nr:hypothetical protein [Gemmatales bacterium]